MNNHIIDERSNTKLLEYVVIIINYLRKRSVGGPERDYTGILI